MLRCLATSRITFIQRLQPVLTLSKRITTATRIDFLECARAWLGACIASAGYLLKSPPGNKCPDSKARLAHVLDGSLENTRTHVLRDRTKPYGDHVYVS